MSVIEILAYNILKSSLQSWQIQFAPQKTFSLIISLKRDLQSLPHPPLFLDGTVIPETSSVQVLGFTFDALLTWEPHIMKILNRGKQRASQLYQQARIFP